MDVPEGRLLLRLSLGGLPPPQSCCGCEKCRASVKGCAAARDGPLLVSGSTAISFVRISMEIMQQRLSWRDLRSSDGRTTFSSSCPARKWALIAYLPPPLEAMVTRYGGVDKRKVARS